MNKYVSPTTTLTQWLQTQGFSAAMLQHPTADTPKQIGEHLCRAIGQDYHSNKLGEDEDAIKIGKLLKCDVHITLTQRDAHSQLKPQGLSYFAYSAPRTSADTTVPTLRIKYAPGHWYHDKYSSTIHGSKTKCLYSALGEAILTAYKTQLHSTAATTPVRDIAPTIPPRRSYASSHPTSTATLLASSNPDVKNAIIEHQRSIETGYAKLANKPATSENHRTSTSPEQLALDEQVALGLAQQEMSSHTPKCGR